MAKKKMTCRVEVKRVYDERAGADGRRILVDRIWPRGLSKEDLHHDAWLKNLAPSTGLRKWFGHDPARWDEFKKRFFTELDDRSGAVEEILALCRESRVTLLYGAKDRDHNNAVALKVYLEQRGGRPQARG
ncbi:MAG: DUF488 domain-containing protein [Kiloniellaceae bacterium]